VTSAPPAKTESFRPLVWCLLSAALFGASTPASKALLDSANPLLLAGLLYAGAALAVAPSALHAREQARHADTRNWLLLLGAVVFGGVIGPALLLLGLSLTSAGSVALWLNLESVATALLARAFFKEHLHAPTWIAVGLIVAASALLVGTSPGGGPAILLVALACVAWGIDNNLTSIIDRFTPAQIAFAKGVVAGILSTGTGLALPGSELTLATACKALAIGGLSYGLSLVLYVAGAQHLGATRSQLVFSTAPAFGLAGSWLVLGEPISLMQCVAFALMAVAIRLWHREHHEHVHSHERTVHAHWHRHDDGHHSHVHAAAVDPRKWHSHEHVHESDVHAHPHQPDLHHRHEHVGTARSTDPTPAGPATRHGRSPRS
jgi:drug/metabolite transporter (DMT)-like permease